MKIHLRLSAKIDANGKSEILLSAKKKIGKSVVTMRAKSGIYVLPSFFDEKKEEIDINKKRKAMPTIRRQHIEAKEAIDKILSTIAKAEESTTPNDKDWLKGIVETSQCSTLDIDHDFYMLYLYYIERKQFANIGKHYTLARLIKRYEAYRRKTDKHNYRFDPYTVTRMDIEELEDYILNEHNLLDGSERIRPKGRNSMVLYIQTLKAFFTWMTKNRGLKNNPFDGIEYKKQVYGNVVYPSIEERDKIYDTPMPSKTLELTRDVWVLQSVLGCRIGDLRNLTNGNIVNDVLTYTPHKTKDETGIMANVPLNDIAKELIRKYHGKSGDGHLMPIPQTSRLNKEIKKVFRIAGVTRSVEVRDSLTGENVVKSIANVASTHMARRCFVGNAYAEVKDPNIVAKMSGHTEGSKSFLRYRKIDIETLKEVTDKIGKTRHKESIGDKRAILLGKLARLTLKQIEAILNAI